MSIAAVFDRVRLVKGYLSSSELPDSTDWADNCSRATDTFLSHGQEMPCHGMCSVGAIMYDLGATRTDFTNLIGGDYDTRTDYDRFVEDLRRYGVMIAQYYFRGYVEEFHPEYRRNHIDDYEWDTHRPLIESWNDWKPTTEEDVRNFLYTLATYPPYRQVARMLRYQESDELNELLAQANRLHEHGDFVNEWLGVKVKIFNQIFDNSIPVCE